MSIVQGGPGFPVLHANVYNYMVTGKYIGVHTPDEDVPNPIVVALLQVSYTSWFLCCTLAVYAKTTGCTYTSRTF